MRGIKGPVGTAQDSIDLLGSTQAHQSLELAIAQELGFVRVLDSTGQVYPRSLDYEVLTTLVQLATSPSSLATSIRLMAGAELVTEGFKAGQVVVDVHFMHPYLKDADLKWRQFLPAIPPELDRLRRIFRSQK